MDALLEFRQVSFSYGGATPAVDDLSVILWPGEQVAVLGNNGAGKTTFFLLCNGILKPQKGAIYHAGSQVDYGKKGLKALRMSVSVVFQDPEHQIIASTVEQEVSFGPMNLGLPREQVAQRVGNSLATLGLEQYATRGVHTLSGGEKKRVTIADILAMEPDLIFMDEPTASLDKTHVDILRSILKTLEQRGIGVVISTHDIDFAYSTCSRALLFSKGKLIGDSTIPEVFQDQEVLNQANLKKPTLMVVEDLIAQGVDLEQFRGIRHVDGWCR